MDKIMMIESGNKVPNLEVGESSPICCKDPTNINHTFAYFEKKSLIRNLKGKEIRVYFVVEMELEA